MPYKAPLSTDQLVSLKQRVTGYLEHPKTEPHGFPTSLVLALIETCLVLRTRKKHWQHRCETMQRKMLKAVGIINEARMLLHQQALDQQALDQETTKNPDEQQE